MMDAEIVQDYNVAVHLAEQNKMTVTVCGGEFQVINRGSVILRETEIFRVKFFLIGVDFQRTRK